MILLQAGQGGFGFAQLFFPIAILAVFYYFIIRPGQVKEKKQSEFIENLKKGNKIVTVGGIYGKVISIEKKTIIKEIDRGTRIQIDKNSISYEMSNLNN